MVFFIDALERLFHDLRIDLRGGDIAVAEHLLQGMQVRAVFEQMGRKAVTQRMRRDLLVDLRGLLIVLDDCLLYTSDAADE